MTSSKEMIHVNWCNYMVDKAKNTPFALKRMEHVKSAGIKTSGLTRAELITALGK